MTGEAFVYQVPTVGYIGAGLIGEITGSHGDSSRLTCEILDFRPFEHPVPLKDSNGSYYEADTTIWSSGTVYWGQGVRPLSLGSLTKILTEANSAAPIDPSRRDEALAYAGQDNWEVEEIAVDAVRQLLEQTYLDTKILVMPRNNPGYDIEVLGRTVERYVEVKGTR